MENQVHASTALEDFVLEELETRLEMATCCDNCYCRDAAWNGCQGGWICEDCHEC